jgi:hypothetical protein
MTDEDGDAQVPRTVLTAQGTRIRRKCEAKEPIDGSGVCGNAGLAVLGSDDSIRVAGVLGGSTMRAGKMFMVSFL